MEWVSTDETTCSPFTPKEIGDDFVDRWKQVYDEYQWDTPHIAQATLHTIMGQLPAIRKMRIYTSKARYEDGRIHTLWMQPSGTGKQGGFDFVSDVSKHIILPYEEFKYETKNKFTSAVLLGGPTGKRTRKYNKEIKAQEEESVIRPGILEPGIVNLFACQEIGPLFDSKTEHNEESMAWFQIAMDPIGRNELTKDILSMENPIKIYPECSIFFASYIPTEFNKRTVQRGFVQRMILIINPVPIRERKENTKRGVRGFGTCAQDAEGLMEEVTYLGKYMSYLNDKYKDVELKVDNDMVTENLLGVVDQIYSFVEGLPAYQQEELQKFTTRAMAQVYKIAWHHCMLRGDTVVGPEDVVYAEMFLSPVWKQMVTYYEDALETTTSKVADAERKWEIELASAIGRLIESGEKSGRSKGGWVFEMDVAEILKRKLRKTKTTIKKKIDGSIDSGLLVRGYTMSNGRKLNIVKLAKQLDLNNID